MDESLPQAPNVRYCRKRERRRGIKSHQECDHETIDNTNKLSLIEDDHIYIKDGVKGEFF